MDDITVDEWTTRFKAHMRQVLLTDSGMTIDAAIKISEAEFDAVEFEDLHEGYENDPEASADMTMSYWES